MSELLERPPRGLERTFYFLKEARDADPQSSTGREAARALHELLVYAAKCSEEQAKP